MQLDKIINCLEYYRDLAIQENHNYVVFSLNIFPKSNKSIFDVKDLKTIFPSKNYHYRWTREYKDQFNTGEHYHVMVIANNTNNTRCYGLRDEIEKLKGVKSCYFAARKDRIKNLYFHNLSFELDDAVSRYCYYSKIDQKQNIINRSFDGSRTLKSLQPIKNYDSNTWRKIQMFNQYNEIVLTDDSYIQNIDACVTSTFINSTLNNQLEVNF